MSTDSPTLHPPLPVADELSAPFWNGVQDGKLLVQRCDACGKLQFPFRASCNACTEKSLSIREVSGRGRVYAFTENATGARHPYFQEISPYLVGNVELVEEEGLIFMSNFPGSRYDEVAIGAPVMVEFPEIADGVRIPQFRLVETDGKGE